MPAALGFGSQAAELPGTEPETCVGGLMPAAQWRGSGELFFWDGDEECLVLADL